MIIVGITGGSGSGKTTIANKLVEALGADNCLLISADRYFLTSVDPEHNFDCPDAYDNAQMDHHLSCLRNGQSITMPSFDFPSYTQLPGNVVSSPRPYLIVEGIIWCFQRRRLLDILI